MTGEKARNAPGRWNSPGRFSPFVAQKLIPSSRPQFTQPERRKNYSRSASTLFPLPFALSAFTADPASLERLHVANGKRCNRSDQDMKRSKIANRRLGKRSAGRSAAEPGAGHYRTVRQFRQFLPFIARCRQQEQPA